METIASYGTFITACGFGYHGPKHIRFMPQNGIRELWAQTLLQPEWLGTYHNKKQELKQVHQLSLKYETCNLQRVDLEKEIEAGLRI